MVLNHSSVALLYTWGCCTVGSWTSALVSSILQTVTGFLLGLPCIWLHTSLTRFPASPQHDAATTTMFHCGPSLVFSWFCTNVKKLFFFFFWSHQLRESFYSFAKYPPCLFGKLQTGFHVFSSKHYSMKLIFMACPGYGFLPNIL